VGGLAGLDEESGRGQIVRLGGEDTAGVPDRIILMPGGRIAFVEVKAPGEKPRPLQLSRHLTLRRLGFLVYVLDALEDIEKIISEVMNYEAS
jgi:hypothetical protein